MSLDALESIVACCCTALEPHHPADILFTEYAVTASRQALLYLSYHVGRYAPPGKGRGKPSRGTGITPCNTRTKKYLVVRNLELTLFGCSLVLFGLLIWLISGLIFGLLIRTTAQCICYLLNTDHHQPRIGILSEDSRLS
jgi:hypothetical protein